VAYVHCRWWSRRFTSSMLSIEIHRRVITTIKNAYMHLSLVSAPWQSHAVYRETTQIHQPIRYSSTNNVPWDYLSTQRNRTYQFDRLKWQDSPSSSCWGVGGCGLSADHEIGEQKCSWSRSFSSPVCCGSIGKDAFEILHYINLFLDVTLPRVRFLVICHHQSR
jgi:hypothetical protein